MWNRARRFNRILLSTALAFALLLVFLPASVGASSMIINDEWTARYLTPTTIELIGYSGSAADLEIPSTLIFDATEFTVVALGGFLFDKNTNLTSVDIPDSVTTIGTGAFSECTNLTTVRFPAGLTTIPASCFYDCEKLTGVKIPDTVTTIGASAFQYCYALTSIRVPFGVQHLNNLTFQGCHGLQSVELPTALYTLGDQVFASCPVLDDVVLPDGLQSLGISCFAGCSALSEIVIPGSVNAIGDYAFQGDADLERATILNSSMTIGNLAFDTTGLAADGIYGFNPSTARTYALAHTPTAFPFHALYECPPVLQAMGVWHDYDGEILGIEQVLSLTGFVTTSNDSGGTIRIYAMVQGMEPATLVATVTLQPYTEPAAASALGMPVIYTADWSGTFTMPRGMTFGENRLVLWAESEDTSSIEQRVRFISQNNPLTPGVSATPSPTIDPSVTGTDDNPTTGDAGPVTPVLLGVAALAFAALLLMRRRRAGEAG